MQETQVQFLGQEDPLGKEMQPTPVFLPGKSHRERSLVGYSPWGRKRIGHNAATTQQHAIIDDSYHVEWSEVKVIQS